ncbi:MAG: hypothetical protein JRS35_20075 [Deltaproteobacteria bacterium]|nr:hypothetical protein [Deltaproteobacteria bacterium]
MTSRSHVRRATRLLLGLAALLCACQTLPEELPRPRFEPTPSPSPVGPLAELERDFRARVGGEPSGFLLLDRNEEALRWRLALADDAVAWLDLQYYLWYRDDAGRLLLEAVLRAADRGVRVRILVDDLLFFGRDRNLRAVDAHPNVQVRLANPWRLREGALGRLVEFLSRMGRLNHRMHNKAMIADGHVAIVGGRNLGDAYFGLSEHSNFHDLDLLAVGPIVGELAEAFGRYWNSELVVEAEALPSETSRDALDGIREKIRSELRASSRLERFPQERADWSERLASLPARLDAGSAKIIVDAPSLHAQREGESYRSLLEVLSAARREVLVATPSPRTTYPR